MIRPSLGLDPLLGRPLALYDVVRDTTGDPIAIDLVYLVIGRGTRALAERGAGDRLALWGPLGNGFAPPAQSLADACCVAGGIGQTPFLALGRWWLGREKYGDSQIAFTPISNMTLLYGVRTADLLAGLEDFASEGIGVQIATDDGTAGHHGTVVDLLEARLANTERPSKILGCGPHPMLAALARVTAQNGLDCELSLENHMACGFGACYSCVAPIRQADGTTDLKRVCVDGPVFPAHSVII
jgi:dihydroorotate dehydrogenase electron transfer subunit